MTLLEAEVTSLRQALQSKRSLHSACQQEVGRLRALHRDAQVELALQAEVEETLELREAACRPAPPVAVVAPVRQAGAAPLAPDAGPAGPIIQPVPSPRPG